MNTYCTPELVTALERGYVVQEIVEIWHFKKKTNQLFKNFIKCWAKIKYEARYIHVSVCLLNICHLIHY